MDAAQQIFLQSLLPTLPDEIPDQFVRELLHEVAGELPGRECPACGADRPEHELATTSAEDDAPYDFDVTAHTAEEVAVWVGGDPARARWALEKEGHRDTDSIRWDLVEELRAAVGHQPAV
jgi:hypothetical protein